MQQDAPTNTQRQLTNGRTMRGSGEKMGKRHHEWTLLARDSMIISRSLPILLLLLSVLPFPLLRLLFLPSRYTMHHRLQHLITIQTKEDAKEDLILHEIYYLFKR